jgi:hypothetical protein
LLPHLVGMMIQIKRWLVLRVRWHKHCWMLGAVEADVVHDSLCLNRTLRAIRFHSTDCKLPGTLLCCWSNKVFPFSAIHSFLQKLGLIDEFLLKPDKEVDTLKLH